MAASLSILLAAIALITSLIQLCLQRVALKALIEEICLLCKTNFETKEQCTCVVQTVKLGPSSERSVNTKEHEMVTAMPKKSSS